MTFLCSNNNVTFKSTAKSSSKSGFGVFSMFKNLVGSKSLTMEDIQPVVDKMKDHLICKQFFFFFVKSLHFFLYFILFKASKLIISPFSVYFLSSSSIFLNNFFYLTLHIGFLGFCLGTLLFSSMHYCYTTHSNSKNSVIVND